jgi:hypothetical protein
MTVGRILRNIVARTRHEERAMVLAEMLVTLVTFTIVMGAILSVLETTAKQAPKDQERALAISEAQAGLHTMTRELRQAYKVLDAQPKSMYVLIARSTPPDKHVKYDCDVPHPVVPAYRRCVRWQALVGQELPLSQPGQVVIDRGLSEVNFSYDPSPLNPTYARVHIKVPQKGERSDGFASSFVLEDGFYLRNTDVGN